MRLASPLLVLLIAASQFATAEGMRFSVGARVFNRCSAKAAPQVLLRCAVPQGATLTHSLHTADGMRVTVLF